MANCGNFLEYAGSKCGLDVGYGKMILIYADKTAKTVANLTATAINAEIAAGTIIGIVKGWHTIAGAPVGEISVERTGTAEMKLVREEIAADVLTFEANLLNRETIADLVKAGSLNCILIDDQGNAFGDASSTAGEIIPATYNFSTKATSSFQHDNATDKTVAVTVRYLVKDLSFLKAETETELIKSKTLLSAQLSTVTTMTATSLVFYIALKEKATGDLFSGTIAALDLTIKGIAFTPATAVYDGATGLMRIAYTETAGLPVVDTNVLVTISGDTFYTKETKLTLVVPK